MSLHPGREYAGRTLHFLEPNANALILGPYLKSSTQRVQIIFEGSDESTTVRWCDVWSLLTPSEHDHPGEPFVGRKLLIPHQDLTGKIVCTYPMPFDTSEGDLPRVMVQWSTGACLPETLCSVLRFLVWE